MKRLLLVLLFCVVATPLSAGMSHTRGIWSPEEYVPWLSVQEHYDAGYQALHEERSDDALRHFMIIVYHFSDSSFYADALFYAGVSYYLQEEYDIANQKFDDYLATRGKLSHFESVFTFKYAIASAYAEGKKRHLFGLSRMPKFASGKGSALTLFDEVVDALPNADVAAQALFAKAALLRKREEYAESLETLQTLVRRFPNHSLAADGYVAIAEGYEARSELEPHNPDLLSLAQINLTKFAKQFPGDPRLEEAARHFATMEEIYARGLYAMGKFYERKKKPHAARIYYRDAIKQYPQTEAAHLCDERLMVLAQTRSEKA